MHYQSQQTSLALLACLAGVVAAMGCNIQDQAAPPVDPDADTISDAEAERDATTDPDTQTDDVDTSFDATADTSTDTDADDTDVSDCPDDLTLCSDDCVDTSTDVLHCGQCDNPCPSDGPEGTVGICSEATCTYGCEDGDKTYCPDGQPRCANLDEDPDDCGECGQNCPTDPDGQTRCEDGDCVLECQAELTNCDDNCTDTTTDPDSCGSCDNSCDDGQDCYGGTCIEIPDCDPSASDFGGGQGDPDTPYTVCSTAHLLNIEGEYLDDHFVLTDDIDLGYIDIDPIGPGESTDDGWQQRFEGHFDGLGFQIHSFTVEASERAGLFGYLHGGEIRRLRLEDIVAEADESAGGIVGRNDGTITDVEVQEAEIQGDFAGGIAGRNRGEISSAEAEIAIEGQTRAGGIVGTNPSGKITNSHAEGTVSGTGYTGGLVGRSAGPIVASSSSADVEGDTGVGGLVGNLVVDTEDDFSVERCQATGSVDGLEGVGGFVGTVTTNGSSWQGDTDGPTIRMSMSTADVHGSARVGGFVGDASSGVFRDVYAAGSVDGEEYVGGAFGRVESSVGIIGGGTPVSIERTFAAGSVTPGDEAGGLIGSIDDDSTVEFSYWNIDATGLDTSAAGTGLTDDEFQDADNFQTFDFPAIWVLGDGDDHPRLWWED